MSGLSERVWILGESDGLVEDGAMPECTDAGKFVVLPLPSLLVPHQSRKEPGMKRIKAAFFWGGQKKVPEKEEGKNKSRT